MEEMYTPWLGFGEATGYAVQVPNWVMPVHLPRLSCSCKNVVSGPLKVPVKVNGTVTVKFFVVSE
jgi:hypothetical protein